LTPAPGQVTVELVEGPLDGSALTIPRKSLPADWARWGATLSVPRERCPDHRPRAAVYQAMPMAPPTRWFWLGWARPDEVG
jgi:hypothetical protein